MGYRYFNRDVSWLAFNNRVLEEVHDKSVPLWSRLWFLSIYSSNLTEFYSVRVAEYRAAADGNVNIEDDTDPEGTIVRINQIVSKQLNEVSNLLRAEIVPELFQKGVYLHLDFGPTHRSHLEFMHKYFMREVIPFLQPVLLNNKMRVFLRNNRPYFAVRLRDREADHRVEYALIKLPVNDLPRFVELPSIGDGKHHIVLLDDIIRHNLHELLPGYVITGAWSLRVARDADLGLGELTGDAGSADVVQNMNFADVVRHSLTRRNVGVESCFYHDRNMPLEVLEFLEENLGFNHNEAVADDAYTALDQFQQFPVSLIHGYRDAEQKQLMIEAFEYDAIYDVVVKHPVVVHYPYQTFEYVLRLLKEAAVDKNVTSIYITQYRVATNSAVVDLLIQAAKNGKDVTVFVELKARFDEKNNLFFAERMQQAGVKVIYSMPGLKVHAKICLINRKPLNDGKPTRYAYLSTGNFNEKTARGYTDHGLFTADEGITRDLEELFAFLENWNYVPRFSKLFVTQFNFMDKVEGLIREQIGISQRGGDGYILLKMNGLQNHRLIDLLYEASMAGVKIDIIVRGICCLVPEQPYSKNITLRRLVDGYLEHGRAWMFGRGRSAKMFLTSSDWLNRNIKKRIEVAVPVEDENIKSQLEHVLMLQLADNQKARIIDCNLSSVKPVNGDTEVRAQTCIYNYLQTLE